MPRTETVTRELFKFHELSHEAQQTVLERNWDWNVDCMEWWDFIYEDANIIGLEIEGFDLSNRRKIDGNLTKDLLDCCKLIRQQHGKDCDTFKTAAMYLTQYIEAFKKWLDDKDDEDKESWELEWTRKDWLDEFHLTEEAQDVTTEFRKALLEDYLCMLDRQYDYQTSKEAFAESIEASECEFLEDGSLA